jgi:hypothetical protein
LGVVEVCMVLVDFDDLVVVLPVALAWPLTEVVVEVVV